MNEQELIKELQRCVQEKKYFGPSIKRMRAELLYETLKGICEAEKRPVTVENMISFAAIMDSDLEHARLCEG